MQHNWLFQTRFHFSPDAGGGAVASPSPSAPSSGDGGGGASVTPAPSVAGDNAPPQATPPSPAAPAPEAPAATPSTPEPATPELASPWDNLGSTDDLDHITIPIIPEVPATPVAPAATPPVQPVTPVPPAPSPTTPEPAAPAAPAQLSPSDPAGIAAAMETHRNEVIAHLAQTRFALSPEDIQALETDVVTAVPNIMARVFYENQVAMQKFLAQAVPGMVKNYQTVSGKNAEAETKFFDTHKALGLDHNNPQHRAVATRIASIYRQSNPNIPLDQLISEVGPMVAMALKLGGTSPSAAPVPRGGTPFRPAVNGGGGAPPTPAEENPWAGLGQTFD